MFRLERQKFGERREGKTGERQPTVGAEGFEPLTLCPKA